MLRKRKSVRKLFGSFFRKKLTSSIFDVVLNVAVSTYRRQQPFADSFFKISQNSQENICVMMNYFCGMVDRRKALSLISYLDHCQRSSPSWISDTPWAGFEPVQNLSSGFDEWSRAVVITITPTPHVFNFITKETLTHLFTCEFCEIFKRSFFTEHSKNLCLKHGAKIVLIVVRTKVRAGCALVRSST